MIKRNRVVITGMGILAPNGIGIEAFWESLLAGRSGIGPITLVRCDQFQKPDRRRSKKFRPARLHRSRTETEADGTAYPVGIRCDNAGARRCGLDSTSGIAEPDAGDYRGQHECDGRNGAALHIVSGHGPDRRRQPLVRSVDSSGSRKHDCRSDRGLRARDDDLIGMSFGTGCDGGRSSNDSLGEAEIAIAGGADAPITPLVDG